MGEPKTPKKRPAKPFRGVIDGKSFTKENQPTSEQKSKGWQEWRKERHLTQSIINMMVGEDGKPTKTFTGYMASLVKNAQKGNPKAIDAVNKCLEDEIIKVAQTNTAGEDQKTELTNTQMDKLLNAIHASSNNTG